MLANISLGPDHLFLLGSCSLIFLLFYSTVALVFYLIRSSEIKTMKMIKDPKAVARNRKQIGESIAKAEKEKRMVVIWPVILIKGMMHNVKKNSEKKK